MHHFPTVSVNCLEFGSSSRHARGHARARMPEDTPDGPLLCSHYARLPPGETCVSHQLGGDHARLPSAVSPINQINCNRSGLTLVGAPPCLPSSPPHTLTLIPSHLHSVCVSLLVPENRHCRRRYTSLR